ncbi:otoferlin-like [Protopterus annectens]|uniref:otoferlin-like n=1 Tax=Protopterus annectens TaxID=7888 RepID=UPI001CFACD7D|nr:otoferlin-like [Protopterus annectens]
MEMVWDVIGDVDYWITLLSRRRSRVNGGRKDTQTAALRICISVIAAQHLIGHNIDPYVCVEIGDQKRQTNKCESTNCPFYNEYFVFEFHLPREVLFDKIIKLSVFHSKNIVSGKTLIGAFKLDVWTVYSQPEHTFFHKWAPLTDPSDIASGIKGYLKCDISVTGKGDIKKSTIRSVRELHNDDIEGNLMIPSSYPAEQRCGKITVCIYRAEGLSMVENKLISNMKKVFTKDTKDLINPAVVISYADQKMRSSVIKNCTDPIWNEKIVFTELFPTLCRRMKIQIKDFENTTGVPVGTHFIDITKISHAGEKGFLPMFGPSWINLYGSSMVDEDKELDEGIRQGTAYRGRLLISVELKVFDKAKHENHQIKVRIKKISAKKKEVLPGNPVEFTLFGAFLEVSMIERRYMDKPLRFHVTIGETVLTSDLTSEDDTQDVEHDSLILGDRLNEVAEFASQVPGKKEDIEKMLISALMELHQRCLLFITDVMDQEESCQTKLDRNRHQACISELVGQLNVRISQLEGSTNNAGSDNSIGQTTPPILQRYFHGQTTEVNGFVGSLNRNNVSMNINIAEWLKKAPGQNMASLVANSSSIGKLLDRFEHKVIKYRKLLIENEYFGECISLKLVPNGLRYWKYPNGLTCDSPMYRELLELFNRQGFELMETMIKHNSKDLDNLFKEVLELEKYIKGDGSFAQCCDSFYKILEKAGRVSQELRVQKCKKVERDKLDYNQGHAYPAPGNGNNGRSSKDEVQRIFRSSVDNDRGNHAVPLEQAPMRRSEKICNRNPNNIGQRQKWRQTANKFGRKQRQYDVYESSTLLRKRSTFIPPTHPTVQVFEQLCKRDFRQLIRANALVAQEAAALCEGSQPWKTKMKAAHQLLQRIQALIEEVTTSLNSVLTDSWQHIPLRTMLPGRLGPKDKTIQAKLDCYFWLGLKSLAQNDNFLTGLPRGFTLKTTQSQDGTDAMSLVYKTKHEYQLRAHIFQARGLLAADDTGLSDPFARVLFSNFSQSTEVVENTLSPTWDQTLVFQNVTIYGDPNDTENKPPVITVEIYDYDRGGKGRPEFIGLTGTLPLVKLCKKKYQEPSFPPYLDFFTIYRCGMAAGELLAAFELLQRLYPLPVGIRPVLSKHRIEVLFWGLRDLKRPQLVAAVRPYVEIECAGKGVRSELLLNYQKHPNFNTNLKIFEVDLPDDDRLHPPISMYVVNCGAFGNDSLLGSHTTMPLSRFFPRWPVDTSVPDDTVVRVEMDGQSTREEGSLSNLFDLGRRTSVIAEEYYGGESDSCPLLIPEISFHAPEQKDLRPPLKENSELDWWSKYYASVEQTLKESASRKPSGAGINREPDATEGSFNSAIFRSLEESLNKTRREFQQLLGDGDWKSKKTEKAHDVAKIKVYNSTLESKFSNFEDWLYTFPLYRGKAVSYEESADEERTVGKFKGSFCVYKCSLLKHPLRVLRNIPSNDMVKVLVRIYIVQAMNLHPADPDGKADPYIFIRLGEQEISDNENYVSKQLNPVFGKCYQLTATFPLESVLTVSVYDWDLLSTDDLIGETKIDLENRYYSRHRATCGLALKYNASGYNAWRDAIKPTQILAKLTREMKIPPPEYFPKIQKVKVGSDCYFNTPEQANYWRQLTSAFDFDEKQINEELALVVLHQWDDISGSGCKLVPEHVETRPLFNQEKPGVTQGYLQMWVDMFPTDIHPPGDPVDISPRKPERFELRVIILNTEDVILDDVNQITGMQSCDIYVTGCLQGLENDKQRTDVHYYSMTGEGKFNWRFLFRFDYLTAEKKMVVRRKQSIFSVDETEYKMPPILQLQVWDADIVSADDFLATTPIDFRH